MSKFNAQNLPFDQYSRQMRVLGVVNSLRKQKQSFKILDVGGYKGATSKLHTLDDVTVLDLFDVKEKNYIKGSALKMPFSNDEFDFVVSFDVFEHIENKDREKFLSESARVAKIGVITAAPVLTPANAKAEQTLNDLYKGLHGESHPWLKEHIEYGLPRVGQVEEVMTSLGMRVITFLSNDVLLWALMQGAIFINSKLTYDEPSLLELNVFYNSTAKNDGTTNKEDSYRHIVCGFKNANDYESVKKYDKKNPHLSSTQKIEIIEMLHEHYIGALMQCSKKYKPIEQELFKKIKEKDLLVQTIHNIELERDEYKRELEHIKGTKSFKAYSKLASAKRRLKN